MEDAIDDDNEHGAAFLDVHTGINDESPVAHAQVAHRYATRADEATADGQHDAARNLHIQASKSFLAAAGMPRAESGDASMMTDAAASETPAATIFSTTDTASAVQSEASTPVDGLVSHGLLLLARSQARAAEQAHWRSRLQKKEEKPRKAVSTSRGAASAGGVTGGRADCASSSNPSDAMAAHDRGGGEVNSGGRRSTASSSAVDGEASAAAGRARSATASAAAASELWPKTADLSALSSPPPSPNRKLPSTEQSHHQTPPEAMADSVMGAPTSNSSNASKASKPTPDAAVAHSVAREFLALEQSLNRFGAQPLRQPPTKPSSAYSSSSSSGSSGRGYSGFNSLSPFLKGNGALSPSSLTRRNGGSSGHSGSNLTSLAEEETPPSDETSYSRGHDWHHSKGFSSVNMGSSFTSHAHNINKNHHLSSLLGESFLELGSTHGNRNSSHPGNGYSEGGSGGVRSGSGSSNDTSDDKVGGPNLGDSLSHSLFSMAVASSPRGGSSNSGAVGRFVSSQELQGQAAELARCLRLTQLLHDENAKLLEDREAYQRAAAAAVEEKAAVEQFKVEYRELFAKVKDEMLRFRAAYPHPSNPASAVPSEAETQLVKLAQAYERKDRKFKEAEALRAKTNKKLEAAEATLKRYEIAFQQLKERAAVKERLRQHHHQSTHRPFSPAVAENNGAHASRENVIPRSDAASAAVDAAVTATAGASGATNKSLLPNPHGLGTGGASTKGNAHTKPCSSSKGLAPLQAPVMVAHAESAPRKPPV